MGDDRPESSFRVGLVKQRKPFGDAKETAAVEGPYADLIAKKEELEQRVDALKYQKAAMEPGEYKKELTAALVELAKVQAELDR